MKLKLGINCGFAINRYIEPEEWTRIVGKELGLKYVQFVADLLNPFLPEDYIENQVKRIMAACKKYNISVASSFTSAFTRVNHLMNPDERARQIWFEWFKKFFVISKKLGAMSSGSNFGTMTFADYNDPKRRIERIEQGIKSWQDLTYFSQDIGLKYLIFEPMSVPREMANTVEESTELMNKVNENCGVPMKICLDIGHSPHPSQRDPYFWIEKIGKFSPIIHIHQTTPNSSNHWPFTEEYNRKGIIFPEKVIKSLKISGAEEALLLFEISHREHLDTDYRVIEDLKTSVNYWRKWVEK
jgi:D-erythrulose 1-phosphate 3-epimerase